MKAGGQLLDEGGEGPPVFRRDVFQVEVDAGRAPVPGLLDQPVGRPAASFSPAAFPYRARKYHTFHSGSTTWRVASRIFGSSTMRFPPRRMGEAMRNQRIASAP